VVLVLPVSRSESFGCQHLLVRGATLLLLLAQSDWAVQPRVFCAYRTAGYCVAIGTPRGSLADRGGGRVAAQNRAMHHHMTLNITASVTNSLMPPKMNGVAAGTNANRLAKAIAPT
jgi:hypothetical protein